MTESGDNWRLQGRNQARSCSEVGELAMVRWRWDVLGEVGRDEECIFLRFELPLVACRVGGKGRKREREIETRCVWSCQGRVTGIDLQVNP